MNVIATKLSFFLLLLLVVAAPLSAQPSADARKAMVEQFRKFPVNIRFTQDFVSGNDYRMEADDVVVNKGAFSEELRSYLQLTMPVYGNKSSSLSVGGFYGFHNIEFEPRYTGADYWHPRMGREHHIWGLLSSYMLHGKKLWDKNITAMANVRGEFSEHGLQRVTGVVVGLMQLTGTERSSLGVGAVLLLNTTSPWPLFPFITYRCQFDERWSLSLMLPQLYVNCRLTDKDKFSAGLSIFGEHFYVRPERDDLPRTCYYSRSNFRPELVYERALAPLAKFFVKGGCSICINSGLYSISGSDRHVDISQKPSLFLQMGVSYGMGMF